ncbi:MAG: dihydrolipoamide acetyltransferase [Deltaproteobacteria bacterium HGW-Deltaproteobacteria-14]|jgi:pyruvate dehydrogenase E2 component (dihydrolipoamide acetyltransferase)|nr:MAG: dihydrolipoamide acetyltransferase [Deltaproteobacteria bacterium HGW-Deltaproteobacteria-14]
MPTIVEMPRLTDTMEEGTLAAWLKGIGDKVSAGDPLADVETDKAVMTFESFDQGVLLALLIAPGDTVPLGAPIAILGKAGEDVTAVAEEQKKRLAGLLAGGAATAPQQEAPAPAKKALEPKSVASVAAIAQPPAPAPTPTPTPVSAPVVGDRTAPVDADGHRVKASPLARRVALERGVDLTTVAGSGPHGRIIKRDVADLEPSRRVAGAAATPLVREDTVVRVSQMRKTIAKRLVESKQSAPHYYLTMSVDADRLVSLRAEINAAQDRLKVSYNDLILRACVVALMDHPEVNVAWEGTTLRRFAGVQLGFAVALDEGLISPVVRDADTLGLIALGERVRELAGRARDQKLESAEYTGASFTVSNLGMYGIDHFTAIINPPGACILAVGALAQQPVVKDGQLAVGHRLTVTLSCDHRAVDGARGAAFLADLKTILEAPLGLLL